MNRDSLTAGLPGAELICDGLADLRAGRCTIPACLAAIGLPRLRRSGLAEDIPDPAPPDPELQLYRLLGESGGDAYSRYNSLLRQLISFEQALDRRQRKGRSDES